MKIACLIITYCEVSEFVFEFEAHEEREKKKERKKRSMEFKSRKPTEYMTIKESISGMEVLSYHEHHSMNASFSSIAHKVFSEKKLM